MRHPEPGAVQPGEGSPPGRSAHPRGDPSLRLKYGSGQDDAPSGRGSW